MRERTAEATWGRRDQGTEGPRVAEISGQCPRYVPSSGNDAISVEYVWDGENRLKEFIPQSPQLGATHKLEFVYDYMGRRVHKKVYDWDSQAEEWEATTSEERKFIYDGWRLLLELEGGTGVPPVDEVARMYTWSRDLSGQSGGQTPGLSGAGGIGGLLSVYDADAEDDYVYFYDSNGNVGQVVDLGAAGAGTSVVAHYEYDPYGKVASQSGAYADTNPYRFSTKYLDDESNLSDFGRRYYHAGLGRWLNRDPIGELGGVNLYAYVHNDPVNRGDYLGLNPFCPKDDDPPAKQPDPQPDQQPEQQPDQKPDKPEKPKKKDPKYNSCDSVYGEGVCETFCNDGTDPCGKTEKYPDSLGIACCKNGSNKPCTCVCESKIKGKYPGAGNEVTECVLQHEDAHIAKCGKLPAGGKNECNAYRETAVCVRSKATECRYRPEGQRCACLKELFQFLTNDVQSGCGTYCPRNSHEKAMDCAGAVRDAHEQLYRAAQEEKCNEEDVSKPAWLK